MSKGFWKKKRINTNQSHLLLLNSIKNILESTSLFTVTINAVFSTLDESYSCVTIIKSMKKPKTQL